MKLLHTGDVLLIDPDERAIQDRIDWLRDWADEPDFTCRTATPELDADGEETGAWLVEFENRGPRKSPNETRTESRHATEAEATATADARNAAIEDAMRSSFEEFTLEAPEGTVLVCQKMRRTKYPQTRGVKLDVSFLRPMPGWHRHHERIEWHHAGFGSSRTVTGDDGYWGAIGSAVGELQKTLPQVLAWLAAFDRGEAPEMGKDWPASLRETLAGLLDERAAMAEDRCA